MLRTIFTALGAGLAFIASASAQNWPTRPMTMVVPGAAGGSLDLAGRILAARLSERWGRQVIVENVGGAPTTGANRVAKAPPDGYQFTLGSAGPHALAQTLQKNPSYNAATDFAPVALVAELSLVLI